jgi:hypothetical protein
LQARRAIAQKRASRLVETFIPTNRLVTAARETPRM